MSAPFPVPPVLAASPEAIGAFLRDLYGRMAQDWWATAFWGAVWGCAFVATMLLLRMFFTRWGDRDVMKKTLGLSLLLHMIVGMLSTREFFPGISSGGAFGFFQSGNPSKNPDDEKQTADEERIGDVVIQGPQSDEEGDNEIASAEGGSRRPGKSPAWERAYGLDPQQLARLERDSSGVNTGEIMPQERAGSAALEFPTTDPTERQERADPFPEADRQTRRLGRPAEAPQSRIDEETADAAPEANPNTAGPARVPRAASGDAASPEGPRRTKSATDTNLGPRVEYGPDLAEAAKAADPSPALVRNSNPREPLPMSRGNPGRAPAPGTAIAEDAAPDATATGSTASRSVTRIGRPSQNIAGAGTLERPRSETSGTGSRGQPGGTGAGGLSAGSAGAPDGTGRLRASVGDPGGEGLTPSIVRSDIEGAIGKNRGKVPAALRLRTSPERGKIGFDMGASEDSERAVEASLRWLASHQHPLGYWEPIESTLGKEPDPNVRFSNPQERERSGFNAHAGLTALAVLAFLGRGHTHQSDDPYADNVDRALRWLVSRQDSLGYLGAQANPYARMYCHGMATIALAEAYSMTRDPALREPLVRAVQYIIDAQSADGGWRYFKGKQGDMSMFGWQLMALKSARTAGLTVPRSAMDKATDFLITHGDDLKNRNLSQFGGLAAYRLDERPKPSMTAEAFFCRQILGIRKSNRAAVEAVEYLLKNLPQRSKQDLYYWYYGTLAMYQQGGEPWQRWNQALRDLLVADQRTDGDFAGSWNPRAPWGDYGGRVYSTAMSTLCLEVYYRFLPENNDDRGDKDAGK